MKIRVDLDLCQGHSVCIEEAPEVFSVEDQADDYPKVKVLNFHPSAELQGQVRLAARYCPNKVITVIEDNE
ncbi:MAG: ferredoxin [Cellvibrionales bacterium]|jgi:ferredoxin|nr:ferredoxin [Cellvibrionales bacterium]HCH21216.1 ferredoxin [Cellvibrionales bacterium]|tara:strand:+ start:263 stop:475 length:213 start_codon:yes stop_codon:yes gene_type:complete